MLFTDDIMIFCDTELQMPIKFIIWEVFWGYLRERNLKILRVNYTDTPKFDETRLIILYFKQMTFHSKIPKIILTPLEFWDGVSINLIILRVMCQLIWSFSECSVNYFRNFRQRNFRQKCHLLKIRRSKFGFAKP